MFILDTNVLSELMNVEGASVVLEWVDAIPKNDMFTTALNCAEIWYGIALRDEGGRKGTSSGVRKRCSTRIFVDESCRLMSGRPYTSLISPLGAKDWGGVLELSTHKSLPSPGRTK
jgi:predicted nucleic acid-binding protein